MKVLPSVVFLCAITGFLVGCEGGQYQVFVGGAEKEPNSAELTVEDTNLEETNKDEMKPGSGKPGSGKPDGISDDLRKKELDEVAEQESDIEAKEDGEVETDDKEDIELDYTGDEEALDFSQSGIRSECLGVAMHVLKSQSSFLFKRENVEVSTGWGAKKATETKTVVKTTSGWGGKSTKSAVKKKLVAGWGAVPMPEDFLASCLMDNMKKGPKIAKDEQYVILHLEDNKIVEAKKLKDLNTEAVSGAAGYAQCIQLAMSIKGDSKPMTLGAHRCSSGACCIKLF